MTIVVNVEDSPLEQVTKQLNKLVEVIKIVELDGAASVSRELLLVKVRADAETRGQVLDAVAAVPGQGRRRRDRRGDHRGDRQRRQARDVPRRSSSRSASASSCSPAWSPSAAARRSISERTLRPVAVPAPAAAATARDPTHPRRTRHQPTTKESPRG